MSVRATSRIDELGPLSQVGQGTWGVAHNARRIIGSTLLDCQMRVLRAVQNMGLRNDPKETPSEEKSLWELFAGFR